MKGDGMKKMFLILFLLALCVGTTTGDGSGQIVFMSSATGSLGGFEIWVMDADGTGPVQLTTNTEWDGQPDGSPDGSKIVYASWGDDDTWDLWVVNADGSNPPVQLTTGPAYEYSPTWLREPETECINDLQAVSDCDSVHLSWTDTGACRYNVYRSMVSGGPYDFLGYTTNVVYDDSPVVVGTTYYYVVRTVDPAGMEICQSNEASTTVSECVPESPHPCYRLSPSPG